MIKFVEKCYHTSKQFAFNTIDMERRKLLVNLGKTRRQCAIMNREDLLQLIDNNRETSSGTYFCNKS